MTHHPVPRARAATIGAFLALIAAGFACEGLVGPDSRVLLTDADERTRIVVAFDRDTSDLPADDWDLVGGRVTGDSLELVVRYAGGCRDHRFWLVAVDGWLELPDAGITPKVGVPLRLAHHANGDPCEALMTETLRFDLDPLRDAFRRYYGDRPATLLLQITDGRDGFAINVFDWFIDPRDAA